MPVVSVIIPNYNHALFLEQRIESVLAQTYQDFELILLDDASTDQSLIILNKYKKHPKVSSFIFNVVNSGSPFGMWKTGFELARGKYIWIAESDDWCDVKFLEKMVPKMKLEDVVVSHCKSFNVNTFTNIIKENTWWKSFSVPLWDSDFVKNGNELLKEFGKYKCPIINVSSALIRKTAINSIDIPIEYKYCGDWLFWSKIFNKGDVAFCKDSLNYIRIHDKSATGHLNVIGLEKVLENFSVAKQISNQLNEKFKFHKNYEWLMDILVKDYFKKGDYLKSRYYFLPIPLSFHIQLYKKILIEGFKKLRIKKYKIENNKQ